MIKKLISILIILVFGTGVAFFVYKSEPNLNPNFENESSFFKDSDFHLGLDLSGGSHLIYEADISAIDPSEVDDSMEALRDVIERRVNIFGVSEPIVQVQGSGFVAGDSEKLIVDLPGVTDVEQATAMIGQTPLLEFRIEAPEGAAQQATVDENGQLTIDIDSLYIATPLTGRYLKRANLEFDQTTREPIVSLQFDETGTDMFATITRNNIGKTVAVYLDGAALTTPVVREEIPNGQAVISGGFNPQEAKQLVGRLNSGALPVPISLLSKQTIGATLGHDAVDAGVKSAIIGFLAICLFLLFWYRLPGIAAIIALSIYVAVMLALFKLIPVTLTAAGIAGFIISIGIAVDANILIFERLKEELNDGKSVKEAVSSGFSRAWTSIRDSNLSTIISASILFWFGTSLIKGFALTLGMGVLISMFSAILVTRILLNGLVLIGESKVARFLFSSGFNKGF